MNLQLLWTDKCLFLVLGVMLLMILKSLRQAPNRQIVKRIFSKPLTVSVSIILLFFLMIGVLDSIHFKPNARSLLDQMLAPMGDVYEKTYSAPMALHLYSAEVVSVHGQTHMVHPRLQYIHASLTTSAEIRHFQKQVMIKAFKSSLIITFLLWIFLSLWKTINKKEFIFKLTVNQMTALFTLFICLFLIGSSYWLSRELHVLGTGKIGEDIFYASVKSIRTGLVIGILTTLFMLPLALLLGIAAGYFGGFIDDAIQYIYTTLSSIPGVLLITASVLSMQTYIANHPDQFTTLIENADARLLALCFILGVTSWTSLCRLLRAEAMKLKEMDYVLAAVALGSRSFKIIRKHLLPNVMHIVFITVVLDFSFLVLAEAVLSYVGVGVSPMTISWGNMINAARLELAREPIVWWPMLSAFIFMFGLVLSSNLFADAVQEAFEPKSP